MRWALLILGLLASLAGCVGRDAEPPPLLYAEEASPGRDAYFEALFSGDYGALDPIIDTLSAEAGEGDMVSNAVLGFAHSWRLSEYRRGPEEGVDQHGAKAVQVFAQATQDFPEDSRLLGFLGSFRQAQGTIEDRQQLVTNGWFELNRSTRRWPEWGYFTQAYGLITFEPDHNRYQQGIDMFWSTLDECAGAEIPRDEPLDWIPFDEALAGTDDAFDARACLNTYAVPHNLEGFFTVFGDFYAKGGDAANAAMMYQNAIDLDDGTWPFRDVAEERLANVGELAGRWADEPPQEEAFDAADWTIFNGPASCTICHQRTAVASGND